MLMPSSYNSRKSKCWKMCKRSHLTGKRRGSCRERQALNSAGSIGGQVWRFFRG
jgi:hypothetical protein